MSRIEDDPAYQTGTLIGNLLILAFYIAFGLFILSFFLLKYIIRFLIFLYKKNQAGRGFVISLVAFIVLILEIIFVVYSTNNTPYHFSINFLKNIFTLSEKQLNNNLSLIWIWITIPILSSGVIFGKLMTRFWLIPLIISWPLTFMFFYMPTLLGILDTVTFIPLMYFLWHKTAGSTLKIYT